MKPFELSSGNRSVLYLDLQMTGKQFALRYAADDGTGELKKHYKFSKRLRFAELRPEYLARRDAAPLSQSFGELLEKLVSETSSSVLVIDGIDCLRQTATGTREMVRLINDLHRLKVQLGISILVVSGLAGRSTRSRAMRVSDLHGSGWLAGRADSVFAIGHSTQGERYIRHLTSRSGELTYGIDNVPVFRLKKIGGNFLGFEFKCFAEEDELHRGEPRVCNTETLRRIGKMAEEGHTIRDIADELEMSRSMVHRILRSSRFSADVDDETICEIDVPSVPKSRQFPGCEEFDVKLSDPKFAGIYSREDDEAAELRKEVFTLEKQRANAFRTHRRGKKNGHRKDAIDVLDPLDALDEHDASPEIENHFGPNLERKLDGYGREIFVESEDSLGRPIVWFRMDSAGDKFRLERKGFGVFIDRIS
jgi:hypothetical protein